MTLTDPLLHYLHHVHEKEDEINLGYMQNSGCLALIVYNDKLIYVAKSKTVLCNGDAIQVTVATGKHLQNDLAKKSGKTHVMLVLPVAMP